MKLMQKLRKNLFFLLLAMTMLGTVGYFYINNIFIPIKLKSYVVENSRILLRRNVQIQDVHFSFLKGFTFRNIRVYQKDYPNKLFLSIDEASFNILLFVFLKNRNIILPTLKLKHMWIHAIKNKENTWNFSDLSESFQAKKNSQLNFVIKKIVLDGSEISLSNENKANPSTTQFKKINLLATLSLDGNVRFKLSALTPLKNSSLTAQGQFSRLSGNFNTDITLHNLELTDYLPFIGEELSLAINKATVNSTEINLRRIANKFTINGGVLFDSLDLVIPTNGEPIKYSGPFQAQEASLSTNENKLEIIGKFSSELCGVEIGLDKHFEGPVNLIVTHLLKENNILTIKADATMEKGSITIGSTQIIYSGFTARKSSLIKSDNMLNIAGDFKVSTSLFKLSKIKELKGSLESSNTAIKYRNNLWEIISDFRGNRVNLHIDDNKFFQGEIALDRARLNIGLNSIILTGPGTINAASVAYDDVVRGKAVLQGKEIGLSLKNNIFKINSSGKLIDAELKLLKKYNFTGSPSYVLNLNQNGNNAIDYKSVFIFENAAVSGLPSLNEIKNLNGELSIKPDLIESSKLYFQTKDINFQFKGYLKDFLNPYLDAQFLSQNLNLETASSYFKSHLDKLGITINGEASSKVNYKGLLSSPKEAQITISAILNNTVIEWDKLNNPITLANGQVDYEKDRVSWKGLNGNYESKNYELTGNVSNFSRPILFTTLSSENLTFKTELKILRNAFNVSFIKGTYFHNDFDLTGDVGLNDGLAPDIYLNGTLLVDLKDIALLPSIIKDKVLPLDPKGKITINGLIRTNSIHWREWEVAFKAVSDKILILDQPFESVTLDFAQRDHAINQLNLSSKIYQGDLAINTKADLIKENMPLKVSARLTNLQLAEYRKKNKVKNAHLSGKLSVNLDAAGPILDPNKLTGQGLFTLEEGYLGHLVKDFKDAEFTNANGNLVIKNGKIITDNTKIYSQTIDLKAKGWVDFNQNINFDIVPDFTKAAAMKSDNIHLDSSSLLANAVNMKITGTLSNPRKKVNSSPVKILGNTTGIIRDGISNILKEVLP